MLKPIRNIFLLMACAVLTCSAGTTAHAESLILSRDENTGEIIFRTEEDPVQSRYENSDTSWWEYIRGEHGEIFFSSKHRLSGEVYLVTDSSGLPDAFQHPSFVDEEEWIYCEELSPEDIAWTEESQNWFSQYPDGSRLFYAAYEPGTINSRVWNRHVKRTTAQCDSILSSNYIWIHMDGTTVWNGVFEFSVQRDMEDEPFPVTEEEQLEIDTLQREYRTWKENYQAWLTTIDMETMTPAEQEVSRKSAGLISPYEITRKAYELCDKISANHSDYFNTEYCRPAMMFLSPVLDEYEIQDIWEQAGDIDQDGEISSSDAAALLTAAAKIGIGEESGLSEEQLLNADLNLDKKFDATDAALLLRYAAQAGTGETQSLQEFIRNILE